MYSTNVNGATTIPRFGRSVIMNSDSLNKIRQGYRSFIMKCRGEKSYKLTPSSEESPYSLCFAVFGLHLIQDRETLEHEGKQYAELLTSAVRELRKEYTAVPKNKKYRQLLAFTLSALSILDNSEEDPLSDAVLEQIPDDVEAELLNHGTAQGAPQSGNQAMFLAIFLLHAYEVLGHLTKEKIDAWVNLHKRWMNRFGFWGAKQNMTHLQFQNGYHQYEILEYLKVELPSQDNSIRAVRKLAEADGHFAPYPGGGGCYDYDAIFMLTPGGLSPDPETTALLKKTADTLIGEQNEDGGFAESLYVRPRSLKNLSRFMGRVANARRNPDLFMERARYALALQRPRHDRIATHWTDYSRTWNESNLWDSWFRMLTLARIQAALEPGLASNWGFINYPGIGYHPLVKG